MYNDEFESLLEEEAIKEHARDLLAKNVEYSLERVNSHDYTLLCIQERLTAQEEAIEEMRRWIRTRG